MTPKYKIIADELRIHIEAGKYRDSSILPTEFSLAQEYQVSRQTVRQALANLSEAGLIEKRQGSGSHILHNGNNSNIQQHRSVAVITTYISDYIFPSILREAENVLSQNSCTPSLFATQNEVATERKVLKQLLNMPIDGILVEGTKTALPNPNLDLYEELIAKGIPLVFIHGNYSDLHHALSVLDDNFGGGRQLVEYLAEKGHTKIAGIFKNDDIQGHQRYAGCTAALRDLDLPMNDKRIFWYNTETKDALIKGAYEDALHSVLQGATAIVCYNDEVASYMIGYLKRHGIKVPQEMAVVSFDNSWYSEHAPIRITSLSHGAYNVGRLAAELLMRLLNGEKCHSEKAPWTLIEKESS